jgi:hypothetical protein
VDNHPELFADCSEAISEVGGYSYSVGNDLRLYPIETAEKGIIWLRLRATGAPSHGSMYNDDNAVTRLAAAVSRIGAHEFPLVVTDTVRRFLEALADLTGLPIDPDNPEPSLRMLGSAARVIGATIRNTANPTMLSAGYKANVIPVTAEATIDARFIPGHEQELLETLDELIGEGIDRETLSGTLRSKPASTVLSWTRWPRRCVRRIPALGRSLSDERRHGRQVVSLLSAFGASGSCHCVCHPTWTSSRCGTESTSGFRSMVCASACACSTGSSPAADMLFVAVAAASDDVAATSARTAKVARLAALLRELSPAEAAVAVSWLSGALTQRQIGVGWASLRGELPSPAVGATLTIEAVEDTFTRIGAVTGAGSQRERRQAVGQPVRRRNRA